MHIYYFLLMLLAIAVADSKVCNDDSVRVEFPSAIKPGASANLLCKYEIGDQPLLSVKWYKDDKKFFSYVSGEVPPIKVFALPGINVDVKKSSSSEVVLDNIQAETVGHYKCQVSSSVPSVSTIEDSKELHIIQAPVGPPELHLDSSYVAYGDEVSAVCIVPPSYPPAQISWKLNGEEYEVYSHNKQRENLGERATTTSFLNLRVNYNTFGDKNGNFANLTCIASISDLYKEEVTAILEKSNEPSRFYAMSSAPSNMMTLKVLAVALFCVWLKF